MQSREKVNRLATFQRPAVVAEDKSGNVNLSLFSPWGHITQVAVQFQ